MECYQHQAKQAIGICKSCHKSVCHDCALIFDRGMACSKGCEKDVREIIEVVERSKKIYGIGDYKNNKLASSVIVWLLLSSIMWGTFFVAYFSHGMNYQLLIPAIIFSVITFIVYRSAKNTGIKC